MVREESARVSDISATGSIRRRRQQRYDQICRYAARPQLQHWIALDDDVQGWAEGLAEKLIVCAPEFGLRSRETQAELQSGLSEMCLLSGRT